MTPLIASFPEYQHLGQQLATQLDAQQLEFVRRRFPDGESYLRLSQSPTDRDVIVVCSLDRPDEKFLSLMFLADTLRELGARHITLVAPYLAYMRQDARFAPGEAVTSRTFARLLSQMFDLLVTVDPHLHRYHSLDEIYSIPCRTVSSAPAVAKWTREHLDSPVFIGPDSESAQWVAAVAALADAPYTVLEKVRHGDRDVEVSVPDIEQWRHRQPVLLDDIISTASTLTETIGHLKRLGLGAPVCIGVHGVFADAAYESLLVAGAARIVTTDTITHLTNEIEIAGAIAESLLDQGVIRTELSSASVAL